MENKPVQPQLFDSMEQRRAHMVFDALVRRLTDNL